MEELIAQQEAYIQNLIARRSQTVFEEQPEKLLGETWWLESHVQVGDANKAKCEYPHPSGRPCNASIKNIYTIKSETGKTMKVGMYCLKKVVSIRKLDQIEKDVDTLRSLARDVNKKHQGVPARTFSGEEKRAIVEQAEREGVLPLDVRQLLREGVPLPDAVYSGLSTTLHNLEQSRKQMEEMKRQKEQEKKREKEREGQRERLFVPAREEPKREAVLPVPGQPRKPRHVLLREALADTLQKEGIAVIETRGQARKACEIGLLVLDAYGAANRLNVKRFSDVVREVGHHFGMDTSKRRDFAILTLDHAKAFLQENGFQVYGEREDEFLFR